MIGFNQSYQSYSPMQKIGQGWSHDSILANELEREVWGVLEKILTPEIKKGENEEVLFAPGSFLPSQNACVWCHSSHFVSQRDNVAECWGWQSRKKESGSLMT